MEEKKTRGKPRNRDDRVEVAHQLLEWAKKDTSINLCEFCVEFCEPMIQPSLLYQWACTDKEFMQTYELAKAYIGHRRERKLNADELHVKAYDLNARAYDYFLDTKKVDEMKQEAEHKKALDEKPPANTEANEQFEQILEENAKLKKKLEQLLAEKS